MPPGQSDKRSRLQEDCPDGKLPYISKSRVKTWVTCPRKFYFRYILGIRAEDNIHLTKGRRIHEAFEIAYENAIPTAEEGLFPNMVEALPGRKSRLWSRWRQHIIGWLGWEADRMMAVDDPRDWIPVGIEEELWMDNPDDVLGLEGSPPLMGFADLIVESKSLPQVEANHGVTIVDFKTGSIPDPQYRDKGIFLEGTFYRLLFEDMFDREVTGVAGYYPYDDDVQSDELVVTPPSEDRRAFLLDTIQEMIDADHSNPDDYPKTEQPLCHYGHGGCDFYSGPDEMGPAHADLSEGECDSKWGTPSGPGPNYMRRNQ